MKTIPLGASPLTASCLAYGCWRLAGTWEASQVTEDRVARGHAAAIAAYEAGYTLFDNADIYCEGVAESILGQVMQQVSGMRDHIVLASKCGIRRPGEPDYTAPYRYDFSAAHILASCEASLNRLGTDRIDLYLLHRPDFLCDPAEVASAFNQLQQSGKVLAFGVSNFRPSQVEMLQKACPMPLVVNQVEISLGCLDALHDGTLDQCLAQTITPMAWSPLGGGRLASATRVGMQDPAHAKKQKLSDAVETVARERGVSRAVVILAWLLKHPSRILPIVGAVDPNHIRDAVTAGEIELSREEWYRLMEAAHGQRLP